MGQTVVTQPIILGHAVKAARRARGQTQIQLANAAGSYPRAIIDIERGRSGADLKLILDVVSQVGLQLVIEPR